MGVILIGVAILFGTIQYLFCLKTEKIAIKLIPVYIIIFFALFALALHVGVFGIMRLNMHQAFAFLLAVGIGAALVGDALAWLAYWLR